MHPRGIRNHNPGNLRRSKDPWQGLADQQTDPDFFQFESAVWGIRALARTLIAYQDKHGLRDVAGIIARWAPENQNDTEAYIQDVCGRAGFARTQRLDLHTYAHLSPLARAIIRHENGCQPYPQSVIDKGLVLAGVEPPRRDLQRTRTVKGGHVAGWTGIAATVSGTLASVAPALPVIEWMRDHLGLALVAIGILVLIGVGGMLWARIDDRRLGLR
ncbi:MAG: structural protein P5 [Rhodospirillales bacterium]|nr:structural protein P5 [Rhodospirillales bacterium]